MKRIGQPERGYQLANTGSEALGPLKMLPGKWKGSVTCRHIDAIKNELEITACERFYHSGRQRFRLSLMALVGAQIVKKACLQDRRQP